MTDMDALFAEINRFPLTAKVPTKVTGRKLRIKNELPLMSQSIANAVATTAWAIASPRGQSNIQKTIERSVNRKFLPFVNAMARGNKQSLHHVYEWNKVGITNSRLFDLVIPSTSRGKANFSMKLNFRPSKSLVPLTEAQRTPNPITGAVVEQRHIFYNKAMVMEYGQTVRIRPVTARYMAFDNPPGSRQTETGLTFTKRPVIINYSQRPTYHGLEMAIKTFFDTVGGRDAGTAVRAYGKQVKRGAEKAAHLISVSTPSDAYAQTVASKISGAMVPVG